MVSIDNKVVHENVASALKEDIQSGDITASLLDKSTIVVAHIIAKEGGVFCGAPFAESAFTQIDKKIGVQWQVAEGETFNVNQILAVIKGSVVSMLTAERVALNFLQTLSATATQTKAYVGKLKNTSTILLDTRKTLPGLRHAQKYATTCGGAKNHRMGLYDAFLIKENHIQACGSIKEAIFKAKALNLNKTIEVEVETLSELKEALEAKPDIIMLDNFSVVDINEAVIIRDNSAIKLEVSGNVSLENIEAIAKTGIDYISVGAITKNIKAIDLSLLIVERD